VSFVDVEAAVLFGDRHAGKVQFREPVPDILREFLVLVGIVNVGSDLVFDELLDRILDKLLFV